MYPFSPPSAVSVRSHNDPAVSAAADYFVTTLTQFLACGSSDGLGLLITSKQDMAVTYFRMSSVDTDTDRLTTLSLLCALL